MHFHAKTSQIPEGLKLNKGTVHKTFKPAGPASNQRSAAAAAFLTCIRGDYSRCGMAWAGYWADVPTAVVILVYLLLLELDMVRCMKV